MRKVNKRYLLQVLLTASAIVLVSFLYALFQTQTLLSFVNNLFSFSAIVLVISGFRYLNNLGAYRIYELILYKFKRLFSISSLSKREAYIEEKSSLQEADEAEHESLSKKQVAKSGPEKRREKQYEDFAYKPVVRDPGISAMFYSSLMVFLFSILLGFMI